MTDMLNTPAGGRSLTTDEQALLNRFLDDNRLFLGPDPDILRNNRLEPRSAEEERVLSGDVDLHKFNLVRGRLIAALNESFTMIEQMGAAPGAKWSDCVTSMHTLSGDMAMIGDRGVTGFAAVCMCPVKFVRKYWMDDPSVGVREGDAFIHNDARYGNIHNTDQSLITPYFHNGEMICWLSTTIHEGENGATEPGGMPASAESRFDEGLKMSPFKIVENWQIKRDILTFLQNSVRDPKLQAEDIKVKLHALMRMRDRVDAVIAEFGKDSVVGALRKTLEDTAEETRRRIRELPDGTVRTTSWLDSTLREHALMKINIAVHVKGDEMTWDLRGTAPELANRSINNAYASGVVAIVTGMLQYVWPDMPRNQGMLDPMRVITDRNSLVDPSNDAPNAMSLLPLFRQTTTSAEIMAKFSFSVPQRYTAIAAATYNQPATFIYGGLTQHLEQTGNFCADINGCGGGARYDRDGEHALSPCFAAMCDTGEHELAEEEMPFVRLVAQKLTKDRMGHGKYRGGLGYEQMMTVRETAFWGFMTGVCGSKHVSAYGLFGGYGCPAYPLAKIKGVNIFQTLGTTPEKLNFDMVEMMNKADIDGANYIVQDAGMAFEVCNEGEVYMICQGSGGGYGDVLEREPALVMKDIEESLISADYAHQIYHVVFDETTLVVDEEATEAARAAECQARIQRGRPYKEFVKDWISEGPAADLPYFGSWGDNSKIIATPTPGVRQVMDADKLQGVMMPDPAQVKIGQLQARVAELQRQLEAAAR
jgi:acetone carboxylase alpha subunit